MRSLFNHCLPALSRSSLRHHNSAPHQTNSLFVCITVLSHIQLPFLRSFVLSTYSLHHNPAIFIALHHNLAQLWITSHMRPSPSLPTPALLRSSPLYHYIPTNLTTTPFLLHTESLIPPDPTSSHELPTSLGQSRFCTRPIRTVNLATPSSSPYRIAQFFVPSNVPPKVPPT